MRVSQRQVVIALLIMLIIASLLSLIYQIVSQNTGTSLVSIGISLLVLIGIFAAYWRGWSQAEYAILIFITTIIIMTTNGEFRTDEFTLLAFLPPILALIVASPFWIVGSALTVLIALIIRAGGSSIYTDMMSVLIYMLSVGGITLARMITDSMHQEAKENAQQLHEALAHAESQAQELSQKAQELETQNQQQRQLLELVTVLETPVVTLADGVMLAPIVGHIDSRRAGDLTRRLLNEVSEQRARMVILDIAGVPTVDTAVAQAILRAVQAIRLLGCEVTVTGISASVASTMTQLGINLAGVRTARTPQEVMSNEHRIMSKPSHN